MSALQILTIALMVSLVQASSSDVQRRSSGEKRSATKAASRGAAVKLGPSNEPTCAHGATYCTDTPDYPIDLITNLMKNAEPFKDFFGMQKIEELAPRMDDSEETPFCAGRNFTIFPKVAKNKNNEWMYIVNLDKEYTQAIVVEICLNPDNPCRLASEFPPGYESQCEQHFVYGKLIAVSKDQKLIRDSFTLPSCCICHFRMTPMT